MEKNSLKYLLTGLPGMLLIAMLCMMIAIASLGRGFFNTAIIAAVIGTCAVLFGVYRTVQMSDENYERNRNEKREKPSDVLDNDMF